MTERERLARAEFARLFGDEKPTNKLVQKVVVCPMTGRKSFEYSGPKSAWMDEFKATKHLQLRISNSPKSPAQNEAFEQEWRQTHNGDGSLKLRGR